MLYDKVEVKSASESMDRMHRLIRIVTEMGTDMVKIAFPNSMHDIQDLVSSHCDDVQIFVAGGEKIKEETLREKISVAMKAGAHGLCLGRNVFQNENQTEMKSINLPVI
jgi:class I fructose-bisphosphate aldolase/fructose-bisphosphate aldolase/2-amino-3,7-dideoxy-D-threo-hept-6-ulosonate synthase